MATKNTDKAEIKKLSEDIRVIFEKVLNSNPSTRPAMLITSAIKHKLDLGAVGVTYVGSRETQGLKMGDLVGGVTHNLERVYLKARQLAINLHCSEDIPPFQEKPLIGLQELQQYLEKMAETAGKDIPKNLMAINVIPQYFKVTTRTIYRWIDKKRLTPYPDTNGLIRVDATEVARYTKSMR